MTVGSRVTARNFAFVASSYDVFGVLTGLIFLLQVHVLPREIFGKSTFAIAMKLMKTFPVWLTDWLLVFYTWLILGNVANYGFRRPKQGPMELKDKAGKTPVLDVGTVNKIRSGHIKVSDMFPRYLYFLHRRSWSALVSHMHRRVRPWS